MKSKMESMQNQVQSVEGNEKENIAGIIEHFKDLNLSNSEISNATGVERDVIATWHYQRHYPSEMCEKRIIALDNLVEAVFDEEIVGLDGLKSWLNTRIIYQSDKPRFGRRLDVVREFPELAADILLYK